MSKFNRPADFRIAPFDGLIRLDPGDFIVLGVDCFPDPPAEFHTERFANLRGAILANSFAIHNEPIILILLFEFGTIEPSRGGEVLIERERVLRRETLGTLRTSATPLLAQSLPKEERADLFRNLAEVIRVRNALAHQPFWLRPEHDHEAGTIPGSPKVRTVSFTPCIADEEYVWEVDDTQVFEWQSLMNSVDSVLSSLRNDLIISVEDVDQAIQNVTNDPLSISIPRGRPIPNPKSRILQVAHGDMPDLPLVPGEPLKIRHKQGSKVMSAYRPEQVGSDSSGAFQGSSSDDDG